MTMRNIILSLAVTAAVLSITNGQDWTNQVLDPNMTKVLNEQEGRLYNGLDARLGQIPYQAFLFIPVGSRSYIYCGGTIISSTWILTAAHCVLGKNSVTVHVGLVDANKRGSSLQRPSSRIIVHPGYRSNSFNDDVALVQTAQSIPYSSTVRNAVLPTRRNANPNSINNIFVMISGWGATGDDGGYKEDHRISWPLKYNNVKIMSYSDCQATGAPTNNMCTERKTVNSGPCPGDSGGPLVYRFPDGANMVLGVTSYMVGKCKDQYQAGFAYVGRYLDWIGQNTGIPIQN